MTAVTPRPCSSLSPAPPLRALVVDDEDLARARLRTLLGDCTAPMAVVGGEAENAQQALTALRHGQFDLVLLDVHMPGMNGVALAREMQSLRQVPAVVFVTAHAEHAVHAFELAATDYLTKPVRLERLQQALHKVQQALHRQQSDSGLLLISEHLRQQNQRPETKSAEKTLIIQDQGRLERVALADVLYFKAELKYVTARTAQRSFVLDSALSELESLYADEFLRIHRNALISKRAVRALVKHHDIDNGDGDGWAVRLDGLAELLMVSRRQLSVVRSALVASDMNPQR